MIANAKRKPMLKWSLERTKMMLKSELFAITFANNEEYSKEVDDVFVDMQREVDGSSR